MSRKSEEKIKKSKSYGNKLGYRIFHVLMKYLGIIPAYILLLFIIPYYVILRPDVYRRSKPYLKRRFPEDSGFRRYLRMFKYIFIFGQTLIDQYAFGFLGESKFTIEFEKQPEMLKLLEENPAIFLNSHVGFWELSMFGQSRFKKKMNIMAQQDFDKQKRDSFYDIQDDDMLHFINVNKEYGGMIEATNALLNGEIVGVSGDRAEKWRSEKVRFLGDPATFPIIAEQLAVSTGAPLIVLLTYRVKPYHIGLKWKNISSDVMLEEGLSKSEKITKMLEAYAAFLDEHTREHPYLWYNFFDFWA